MSATDEPTTAGETATFTDTDGVEIGYRRWLPASEVRAVVLIAHGASEHSARYDRFARALTARGYAVYAIDHRGHGLTIPSTGPGQAGPRGWEGMVDDLRELADRAEDETGTTGLVLFGHSMGSFLSQIFAQRHGDVLTALVLSGSSGGIDGLDDGIALLDAVVEGGGGDAPAPLFDTFNDAFEPARTSFDWLSRDASEVDKYIADPLCGDGVPITMTFALDMLRHLDDAWSPANEARIPAEVPVLMITGEADPVSDGGRTVRQLEERYRARGQKDLTALYYPDARHELLNELNRDAVQAEVVDWIVQATG